MSHTLQGMCTFVDHPTRGKLHFAYTKDYKGTSKTQQSLKATPLSPSVDNAPRRLSNACVEEFKYPVSPQSVTPGLFVVLNTSTWSLHFSIGMFLVNSLLLADVSHHMFMHKFLV